MYNKLYTCHQGRIDSEVGENAAKQSLGYIFSRYILLSFWNYSYLFAICIMVYLSCMPSSPSESMHHWFSLENDQGIGGGCGLESTSKNLGQTHCHIKGIWMQKMWSPLLQKGLGRTLISYNYVFHVHVHVHNSFVSSELFLEVMNTEIYTCMSCLIY